MGQNIQLDYAGDDSHCLLPTCSTIGLLQIDHFLGITGMIEWKPGVEIERYPSIQRFGIGYTR